ncbi:hypothetical protein AC579_1731 [Lecanosticta acicola]|uniref:Thioesterase domain-containing protein n=1 Tax=Lecanosticta acicola TaxID=111012 RepID=A0AAI8Z2C0_9PEZI|nr:hypothetical protein AC579_1731 [Lecanosticta acicola]
MAVPRPVVQSLLASPPALRTVIARDIFGVGVTRPLTAITARENLTLIVRKRRSRIRSYAAESLPGGFPRGTRFLSSSTATATPESSRPSPSAPNLDQTSAPPPRRSILRRLLTTTGLFVVFFTAGFAMAATPAAEAVNGFVNPPTDAETLDLFEPATPTVAEINEYIVNHPLSKKLRAQEGMTEARPHLKIPPAMREHNLTGGTLLGPNKIEVPPLTFNEKSAELPKLVQISRLGPGLCGHPGIVHGGLLATMLDEGLARACFPALPNKVGVTASLKIDYRSPCPENSYVVLKAETTKVEGRKAWVKGRIETLGDDDTTGTLLVEAEALFIEPKQAANMARVYSSQ